MLRSPPLMESLSIRIPYRVLEGVMTWTADWKKQVRSRLRGLAEAHSFEPALVLTAFAAAGTVTSACADQV